MREGGLLTCVKEYSSKCKDPEMKECLVCSKNSKMVSVGRVVCTNRKVLGKEDVELVRENFVGPGCIRSVTYSHGVGGEWSEQGVP